MEEDSARPDSESAEQQARSIWADARKKVEAGDCDFTGRRFPEDPDGEGFKGITFRRQARFGRATFEGSALFGSATFKESADFDGATFDADADFTGATFESVVHLDVATFEGATFQGYAVFKAARFKGSATFDDATFKRLAHFGRSKFLGDATFRGVTFGEYAAFQEAAFEGNAWFTGATFKGVAFFTAATFKGDAGFEGAEAKGLSLVYPWQRPRPFRWPEAGESAYRAAKQSAQRRGDYRRAGHYHYAEQCAINTGHWKAACRRPWRRDFWRVEKSPIFAWGEFLIGRKLFGYGERPLHVVLAAMVVILFCTAIYYFGGVVTRVTPEGSQIVARHELLSSLYFSIVTFTTLGYGDLRPPECLRLAAAAEALIGAGLMALFIVCLARKFTR